MTANNSNKKLTKQQIINIAIPIAKQFGIPAKLFLALINQESGFNAAAKSSAGALGLTQLMPSTAASLGVNPLDPIQNLIGGARYLAMMINQFKDYKKALAAYNAGAGAVKKYNGIPPYKETQNYVKSIMAQVDKMPDIPAQDTEANTTSNEGVTGGASGINPDDALLQGYLAPETLSGYKTSELVNQVASPTSAQGMMDKLAREYAVASRDLTPTEQQILNKQVALDPNVIMQADQQRNQAILQAQQNLGGQNQGMLDMINKAYENYMNNLKNDYRLQNTGYQLSPKEMRIARTAMAMNANNEGRVVTPQELALMEYQTNIANQYGIPYDQYMAAMADIQAKQQEAQLQQIQDYITFAKNNGATDQEIIKQLGNTEGMKQLVENAKIQGNYSQAVAAPYMTQAGQLRGDYVKGVNDILTANQQNVTDLTKQQMINQGQLAGDILRAQTQKYGYDTTAGTALRGQDVDAAIANMQQGAKDVNAAASLYNATADVLGYTPEQRAGIINALPAQQRSIVVNPAITPAQLPQVINPNNQAGGTINTQNPYSFQNLMNRFNANRTLQQ